MLRPVALVLEAPAVAHAGAHGVCSVTMPDCEDHQEKDGTAMAATAAANGIAEAQKIHEISGPEMRRPEIR